MYVIFYFNIFEFKYSMGIGDWGLGIGDWAQSPIPNPQSPIPNKCIYINIEINKYYLLYTIFLNKYLINPLYYELVKYYNPYK